LSADDPGYKDFIARAGKAVAPRQLIACALAQDSELSARIARNADVRAALQLERDYAKRFPDYSSTSSWALNVRTDPQQAERLKIRYSERPWMRISDHIDFILNTMSASEVLDYYWLLQMAGRNSEARAQLEAARKRGLPLPAI
jgi:hypothetical protein